MSAPSVARRSLTAIVASGVMAVAHLGAATPDATAWAPPGWGADESVASHAFEPWDDPETHVAVTASGVAFAAWLQPTGDRGRIYAARRDLAGSWSAPVALSPRIAQYRPFDLAVGAHGLASVVWQRPAAGAQRVQEAHFAGGAWSAPVVVARGSSPEVAVDASGTTTLVYRRAGLVVQRRTSTGAWGAARKLTSRNVYDVAVASDSPGNVVVAWEQPAASVLRARVRLAAGGWQPARTLTTLAGRETGIGSLEARFGPQARALVVWTTTGDWREAAHAYRNGVGWARSTSTGAWSATQYLTRAIGEDGGDLRLSTNAAGQALAVWTSAGGGSEGWVRLDAARFRADGTWGPVVELATKWFTARAWLDDSGTAYLLAHRGRSIWQVTQAEGHGWSTRSEVVPQGHLLDGGGTGHRLLLLWLAGSPDSYLWAKALDTP